MYPFCRFKEKKTRRKQEAAAAERFVAGIKFDDEVRSGYLL